MADPKINVLIGAKIDELVKALTDSESRLQKFATKMQDVGKNLTAAVTLPLIGIGGLSLKVASDFEETASKFGTVFSSISKSAENSFQTLRSEYGLSSLAAKQLLSDTGDLLTGFGFSQQSALELSTQVQKLAVDLASFTNFSGGATGASEALTKALIGERDSLKALGIAILEEDVKKQVAINTAKGLVFETERQAQAQATLDLAFQQSKNAIGDYARTQEGFANQTRLLQSRLQDLATELGTILIPIATKITKAITGVIESFRGLDDTSKKLIVIFSGIAASIGPLLFAIGSVIKISPLFIAGFTAITGPVGLAVIAISALAAGLAILATNTGLSEEAIRKQTVSLDIYKTANNQLAEAQNLVNKANTEYGRVSEEVTEKTKEAIKAKIEDVKATILQAEAANKLAVAEAKKESLFDIIVGFERVQRRVAQVQKEGADQTAKLTKELNELTVSYLKIGSAVQQTVQPVKRTFEEFSEAQDKFNQKFFEGNKEIDTQNFLLERQKTLVKEVADIYDKYAKQIAAPIIIQQPSTDVDISGFQPTEETADNPFTDAETKALAAQSSIKRAMESLEKELNDRIPTIEERLTTFGSNVDDIIRNNVTSAFIDLGYTIGEALASGANVIQAIGESLLNSMGKFLGQLGEQLIAFGVAGLAFGKVSLGLTNPFTAIKSAPLAIAAGVALTAISGAIGSIGKRGLGGGGSFSTSGVSGGTTFSGQGATGLQFDRSLQLSGEFRVKGQDLVYVFNEASTKNQRG
jgi:hypothetical protein